MRRISSSLVAFALAAGGAVLAAPVAPVAAAASVTLDGHGYGHGVGLSQWGAYGYAVDLGWTADQILDRYYGGTVSGVTSASTVTVRLQNLDDAQTAVVNDAAQIVVEGVAGGPWMSAVARETAPGSYTVYARSDARVCPGASADLSPVNGWFVVAGPLASVTFRTLTDTTASTDYAALLAVCEPAGKVRSYRGAIRAVNGTAGENRTVNEVPLEQYLRAVIAKEMSPSWATAGGGRGKQALRAQAVAARSYALAENRYSYARTCDLSCQAYLGAAVRNSVSGSYTAVEHVLTDAEVVATAGVVRRVGNTSGAIAYTMFSASSGGYTAPTTLGFTPVPDDGDDTALNPNHSWTTTVSAATLQAAYPTIGTFTGITVLARNGYGDWGGRVTSVRIDGSAGSVTRTGDQLRSTLGLKSNWFNVAGSSTPPPAPPDPAPSCAGRDAPPVTGGAPTGQAARFTPLSPERLVDTRIGLGTEQLPVSAGCTLQIDPGLDPSVTAVAVNVTSVYPAVHGFITAYPCGIEMPLASIVQALPARDVAGATIVPLGADGTFCIYVNTTTDLVVDLFGSFQAGSGSRFEPVEPARKYDSRSGAKVPGGSTVRVKVAGTSGVPAGASAAALTVHASDPAGGGYATVYPCSATVPLVSSANALVGGSVANHVEVALDSEGYVCVYASTTMHLTLDVSGWYGVAASSDFYAVTPVRVVDTRINVGLTGAFTKGANRSITLSGANGLPAAGVLRAVAAMVTEVQAGSTGYLTVHPCEPSVPGLSMVRYTAAGDSANVVTGIVDGAGRWCIMASTATHVLVDVSGYFR